MMLEPEFQDLIHPIKPRPTGALCRGKLAPPVKAVLFDIYGTLLISASGDIGVTAAGDDVDDTVDNWVRTLGFAPPPGGIRAALTTEIKKAHERARCLGTAFPEVVIEDIWGRLYPTASPGELRRLALGHELRVNPVWPMPGMRRSLQAHNGSGRRLGLVSNAQFYTPMLLRHFLQRPLTAYGLSDALCIYSYRQGAAKPGRTLYETAAAALKRCAISPGEAVMVGNDRRNDVAAAREVGFQTVLFAGDARSLRWRREDADWELAQPDMVITELTQLNDHLSEHRLV